MAGRSAVRDDAGRIGVSVMSNWWNETPCQESDPEIWQAEDLYNVQLAKDGCDRCPGKTACLMEAMKHREPVGIWGGLTPTERHQYEATYVANGGVLEPIKPASLRLEERLRRAYTTRKVLVAADDISAEELRLLNMVISFPTTSLEKLALELRVSAETFRRQMRELDKRAEAS